MRRALAMLCLSMLPVAASGLDVAEWGRALSAPALRGAGIDAAGQRLDYGHLTLALTGGRLVPVVAGDQVVGIFFVGSGTFRYVSAEPLELAAYRTNVRRNTAYEVDATSGIGDAVESALVMFSHGGDRSAPAEGWPAGEPPAASVAAFARHLERFANDRNWRFNQILPQALVEAPAAPVVMIEMVAAKHDLNYVLDPLRDRDETLVVMKKAKTRIDFLKDLRFPEALSNQPLSGKRLDTLRPRFVLTGVDVTLVNPDGLRANVDVRETIQALEPIKTVDLALDSSEWGGTGISGDLRQNPYTLAGVTLADGTVLPFQHLNNNLVVGLPSAVPAGAKIELRFQVSGDILFRPENLSFWWLFGHFIPTPHREGMQFSTVHAVIKVKKPFLAFSSGTTVRRWEEGDLACVEFSETKPVHHLSVLAGRYKTVEEKRGGLTVSVSTYVMANERSARQLINNAFALVEFYKPYLGDYPFSELKIVEINSYGFGVAPPGMVFITKEAFEPLEDVASQVFSGGVNARLAHEVAHAWWAHVAIPAKAEDRWLSESMSQYFAAVAVSKLWRASQFQVAVAEWKSRGRYVKDRASVVTADLLGGDDAEDDIEGLLYGKGPLVLHALREQLGDDLFFTVLKSFLRNFAFKPAETRHFIGLTSFAAKKDYTDFFNRYLLGTEWPKG